MLNFIEKTINIQKHEFPRASFAWLVKFLHRSGYIIGWTVITAIFVTKFSIKSLPLLFLIQALLSITGMFFFSIISNRLSPKTLMIGSSFMAGLLLLIAAIMFEHTLIFFTSIFLVFGILIPQIGIFIGGYLEEFFSPLEVERISPIIESAETIGGIFGGLLIASLSTFVTPNRFFYVWTFLLFLMISVILFLQPKFSHYHHLFTQKEEQGTALKNKWKNFRHSLNEIQRIPFLQLLFCIFLFNWIIAHLMEYQYTSIIDAGAHNENPGNYEGILTHGLASFQILFHSSALIVQLFLASRILKKFGTAASFSLHAIMTFLSACALLLGFGSFTTILAKNNFEISGIIQKNAYEASYYALKHDTRQMVREFFEAFLYPLGTIVGTMILLLIQWFFLEKHINYSLQMVLFSLTIFMVALSLRLQHRYTNLAKKNLLEENHLLSKFHAIEILSQKGHRQGTDILLKALHQKNGKDQIKIKILETLGKIGEMKAIPDLLLFLHHEDPKLVLATILALESFPNLEEQIFNHAFSRYRIITELKDLFLKTKDEQIQIAIIKTLAHFRDPDIVSFLIEIIKNASPSLQATGIKVCGIFQDISAAYFLEPYLKSKNSFVKAQAIVSLWQFKQYHNRLRSILKDMLLSIHREEVLAACSIIGDIGKHEDKKTLIPYLTIIDPELRLYASASLLKLGYKEATPYFAHLLLSKNSVVLKRLPDLIHDLKPEIKETLKNLLQKEVSRHVHSLSHNLDNNLLECIQRAYQLLGAYGEAESIQQIIEKKDEYPQFEKQTLTPVFQESTP